MVLVAVAGSVGLVVEVLALFEPRSRPDPKSFETSLTTPIDP